MQAKQKLKETLEVFTLYEEPNSDFVDVLNSGLFVKKSICSTLFAHQKRGIVFLYDLYHANKGGLLADDMGLGKTIQIIAFLSAMFETKSIKYVLLVMPPLLIPTWMSHFEKWTPGIRCVEFHGRCVHERSRNLVEIQNEGGIAITTYKIMVHNCQLICMHNEQEFIWDYIILDEAHNIKKPSSYSSQCAHNISAKYRILLTSTPVLNDLREMWALFDFACKGTLLGTWKEFQQEYEKPITRGRKKNSTPEAKALGTQKFENLMDIIEPCFLRRTKEDIEKNKVSYKRLSVAPCEVSGKVKTPEMPAFPRKNDVIVWVSLAEVQKKMYLHILSSDQVKELSTLPTLNLLKKLCNHPRLLPARDWSELGLGDKEIEYTGPTKIDHISDESLFQESGKLLSLTRLLKKHQEKGHRTLVFSQSRTMLMIIERILKNSGFKVMRIDGKVSDIAERERRINMFQTNTEYSVFLLTTQVGGVGITLTAADRVVIFDPSWDPDTDAQAVDRAYRIGQTEPIVIYRLITRGTVEEKIYRRQVLKEPSTTGDFTKQALRELFSTRSGEDQEGDEEYNSEIESLTDELKGYPAISGLIRKTDEQKPMDTSLIMEDHAMLENSDALNSSDNRNKASSKNILSEGIFKSPVEDLVQPSLASGLSCSMKTQEGMLQLSGQFRPIGHINYESDSLASQSPFQCDIYRLQEESVKGELSSNIYSPFDPVNHGIVSTPIPEHFAFEFLSPKRKSKVEFNPPKDRTLEELTSGEE